MVSALTPEPQCLALGKPYQVKRGVYFEGDVQSGAGYVHGGLHARRLPCVANFVATVRYFTEGGHVCEPAQTALEPGTVGGRESCAADTR